MKSSSCVTSIRWSISSFLPLMSYLVSACSRQCRYIIFYINIFGKDRESIVLQCLGRGELSGGMCLPGGGQNS